MRHEVPLLIGGLLCAGLTGAAAAQPVFCDFDQECRDGICRDVYERAVVYGSDDGTLMLFWAPYEKPITLRRTSDAAQVKRMYAGDVPGFFFYTDPEGGAVMSDRISAVSPRTDYKGRCGRRFD